MASPALLDELDEKLRTKFKVAPADARAVRARLEGTARLVTPGFTLDVVVADPDDNRVLECAVAGEADCIVSGDRHVGASPTPIKRGLKPQARPWSRRSPRGAPPTPPEGLPPPLMSPKRLHGPCPSRISPPAPGEVTARQVAFHHPQGLGAR